MDTLGLVHTGEITLPDDVRQRQGLLPDTPVRVIEMGNGVLAIRVGHASMSEVLREDLASWQAPSPHVWKAFPYKDDVP